MSYFRDYFDPDDTARYRHHSAGWIARHLYSVLNEYGPVDYIDSQDCPRGLNADLMVGHFWAFADQCIANHFKHQVAVYSIANPDWTRTHLTHLAQRFSVPFPEWDFPPSGFQNDRTLRIADRVLLIGNRSVEQTFPREIQKKIHRLNYSVDTKHYKVNPTTSDVDGFCYVATQCDLRKGFMDVLQTWQRINPALATLQIVGSMHEPWQSLYQQMNRGNLHYHGWIDSSSQAYLRVLQSSRFAYMPSYSEGLMGTLLEAIFCGCIPITTRMSGIDERVQAHCLMIDPLDIDQQQKVIEDAAGWSHEKWLARMMAVKQAADCYLSEAYFRTTLRAFIETQVLGDEAVA